MTVQQVLASGDGSGFRLTVTDDQGRPLLVGSLQYLAVHARYAGNGLIAEVLPFTYRVPVDPEEPDAPRPLRRARLMLIEDGPVR